MGGRLRCRQGCLLMLVLMRMICVFGSKNNAKPDRQDEDDFADITLLRSFNHRIRADEICEVRRPMFSSLNCANSFTVTHGDVEIHGVEGKVARKARCVKDQYHHEYQTLAVIETPHCNFTSNVVEQLPKKPRKRGDPTPPPPTTTTEATTTVENVEGEERVGGGRRGVYLL
uniref:Secreted protein n=1 Tax=Panagrolaimus sp. JU765 TaxID=591449 RepID=A0AC34RTG5_9BILA